MDITTNSLQELINKRAEAKAKSEISILVKAIKISGLLDIEKIYINEDGKQRDLKYCISDESLKVEDNILTKLYNIKLKNYIVSETKDFLNKVERLVEETDNLLNIAENF